MIRLFTDHPLTSQGQVPLTPAQANYLCNVMRCSVGDQVLIFDGQNGEWLAQIDTLSKKAGALTCLQQTKPQAIPRDIHLIFAPLKKTRTDFVVEKACEMGCASVMPVFTDFTNSGRVNTDRLRAVMIEAAEQCGMTHVPILHEPVTLKKCLSEWNPARSLLFCNERQTGKPIRTVLESHTGESWSLLIGPEGGFSDAEVNQLEAATYACPVTLGPRILRAETAVVAALTAWQMFKGDWVT
jgi:16S rRNA (uracil1498-N3)-methyltransferase